MIRFKRGVVIAQDGRRLEGILRRANAVSLNVVTVFRFVYLHLHPYGRDRDDALDALKSTFPGQIGSWPCVADEIGSITNPYEVNIREKVSWEEMPLIAGDIEGDWVKYYGLDKRDDVVIVPAYADKLKLVQSLKRIQTSLVRSEE